MGVTGKSELFNKYLESIGAAMIDAKGNKIQDNIKGSQCWCPITNLDTADAAYEWNMGQYFSTATRETGTFTKSLSDDLVSKYVEYVNAINLKDPNGNNLSLTSTNEGTYYNYLKSVIEESLNNFLSDTTFPYTPSSNQGIWVVEKVQAVKEAFHQIVMDLQNNQQEDWIHMKQQVIILIH